MRPAGTEEFEELRLALVLNGGVSLAVWIGGVAQEVNRMVRREGVYGALSTLTETLARVDVISGSSAGGLNGALLALAMTYGQPLDGLRDLWVDKAALVDLMRSALDAQPPSLLDGDGYFLQQLRETFQRLKQGEPQAADDVPIDLTITTTLLRGQDGTSIDDFGNSVSDFTYRGTFHFIRGAGDGRDDLTGPAAVERLALAARATASFPGAFEAAFCPVTSAATPPWRVPAVDMKPVVNFDSDRFVVDGGVLANKPIGPALEAIFKQRPNGDVRRVLAYVVPEPEELPTAKNGQPAAPDDPAAPPTLAKVVIDSLVNLPRAESIGSNIDEIREHNDRVRRLRRTRVLLTSFLPDSALDEMAAALYAAYRHSRMDAAINYLISEISSTLAGTGSRGLGQRGRREWLMRVFASIDQPWVPREDYAKALTDDTAPAAWRWGNRPIEEAAQLAHDVLRRCQRLARASFPNDPRLLACWRRIFAILEEVSAIRELDRAHWRGQAQALGAALGTGTGDKGARELQDAVERWARTMFASWLTGEVDLARTGGGRHPAREAQGVLFGQIADILIEAKPLADAMVTAAADREDWKYQDEAAELSRLLGYFVRTTKDTGAEVRTRLLRFEVITRATGIQIDDREQVVDFVQVSAAGPSAFPSATTIGRKLAGVQLAHFGAFYKRSWRANDWMFGRLDMARHLVQILLDPERLRLVLGAAPGGNVERALDAIESIAFPAGGGPLATFLRAAWRRDQAARELRYVDDWSAPVPEHLPECMGAVTRRLQFEILCPELDSIFRACVQDRDAGGAPRARGAAFISKYQSLVATGRTCADLAPEQVVALFTACTVGEERLEAEVGSDLFLETAARSLAVAVAAGQGNASGLGPLRGVLKTMRAPALGVHLFATAVLMRSKATAALLGVALAFTVTVLSLRVGNVSEPTWLLKAGVTVGVALLVGVILRRPRWLAAVVCVPILVGGFLWYRGVWSIPSWTLEGWRTTAIVLGVLFFLPSGVLTAARLKQLFWRTYGRVRGWPRIPG